MTAAANQGLERLLDRLEAVEEVGPNSWKALCPLHDDHRPSLHVDIKFRDGRPHPYLWCGVCGPVFNPLLGHLAIEPASLYEGLTYRGDAPAHSAFGPRRSPASPAPAAWAIPAGRNAAAVRPSSRALWAAHRRLLSTPELMRFLADERGLTEETVRRSRLGFDDGFVVPVYEHRRLVNVRTYRPSALFDRGPKWRGLAGVRRALYPDPRRIGARPWVLLVEGEFDALIAGQHGLPAWTQTGGAASSLPVEWDGYFRGRSVAVCYDCDDAGRQGADRVTARLAGWGCRLRIVDLGLGRGEDVTDWFVRYGRTAKELRALVGAASEITGGAR